MSKMKTDLKRKIIGSLIFLIALMGVMSIPVVLNAVSPAEDTVQAEHAQIMTEHKAGVVKAGLIAASIAFGLGAIGAGIAIANVGAAAMGAISEKPEIAGQALIFIALVEGLVIFGFIIALMILGKT